MSGELDGHSGRPDSRGRTVARSVGLAGAVIGAAVGVMAGVALERYLMEHTRGVPDPYAQEPFGRLPADRTLTVRVDSEQPPEHVDLHVEVVEPPDGLPPDLTVVFVHGFCLNLGTFHFQRRALTGLAAPRIRMVFYDQPGHGRSGRLSAGEYTLDALGEALAQVIGEVAPDGPLALVGHSMGGMTIMALAEQDPELFAERVVGVSFISSSAGGLDQVNFGLPDVFARIRRPLMPVLTGVNRLSPTMVERARRISSDLAWLLTRRYGFGSRTPSQALVSYVEQMNSTTTIEVIVGYLRTLFEHLRHEALETLQGIETLVIGADKDLITPASHSEEVARLLPGAELVVVKGGGHMVLMEFHETVTEHLAQFLQRAARAGTAPSLEPPRRRFPRPFRKRAQ
jgi:pimeloyl-ACP methyl ester carboxylesterase